MKYIIQENDKIFLIKCTFKPANSVMEYTGQIAEEDIKYAIFSDVVDTAMLPVQSLDENDNPIFETLQRFIYDEEGQEILDENEDPILEDYQSPVYNVDGNGDVILVETDLETTHKEVSVDSTAKTAGDAAKTTELDDEKWSAMRLERDAKLTTTDYVMLSDSPIADTSAYETYRQELRDLPDDISDIDDITWPTEPS